MDIVAVVYTSNTGHTKEYASILSEKLSVPCYELGEAKSKLTKEANIIYLGWLMAGTIKGFKKAKSLFNINAVCAVGMSDSDEQLEDVKKSNHTGDIKTFLLAGGLEKSKLTGVYKFMMNVARKGLRDGLSAKKDRTEEEEKMLKLMLNDTNLVSEERLLEVMEFIYG